MPDWADIRGEVLDLGAFSEALARDVRIETRREDYRRWMNFSKLVSQGWDVYAAAEKAGLDSSDPNMRAFLDEQRAAFRRP